VAEGRLIVLLRSRKLWEHAVPELRRADVLELSAPRNQAISPRNVRGGGFARLVDRLRRGQVRRSSTPR
jgi:hypothetical protein